MSVKITIPQEWNSLNDRQLKSLAILVHRDTKGVFYDYRVFIILLNIRWWQLHKKVKAIKVIHNVGFSELKKHYAWLYEDIQLTRFIPSLKVKGKTLIAPADRINNLTVDEFSHAEDVYLGWLKTKEVGYLYYLAAILYREATNDKRLDFDKTELESRSLAMQKLSYKTLLAIALSYQGARSYLTKQFPIVFPKTKSTSKKMPSSSGFGKLILHLSGQKFGTHTETRKTNVYTFLSEFQEQLKNKPYA